MLLLAISCSCDSLYPRSPFAIRVCILLLWLCSPTLFSAISPTVWFSRWALFEAFFNLPGKSLHLWASVATNHLQSFSAAADIDKSRPQDVQLSSSSAFVPCFFFSLSFVLSRRRLHFHDADRFFIYGKGLAL